jgi:predicted hydrocarbon binding protein
LLEGYFTKNGWGTIVIHLNDAQDYGFVRVSLQQSIFADALKHIEGPVDFMIAGMLRGMFETISGHSLDCLQICCAGTSPDQSSEFLISAPGRMAALSKEVGQGISVDDAIARLRSI